MLARLGHKAAVDTFGWKGCHFFLTFWVMSWMWLSKFFFRHPFVTFTFPNIISFYISLPLWGIFSFPCSKFSLWLIELSNRPSEVCLHCSGIWSISLVICGCSMFLSILVRSWTPQYNLLLWCVILQIWALVSIGKCSVYIVSFTLFYSKCWVPYYKVWFVLVSTGCFLSIQCSHSGKLLLKLQYQQFRVYKCLIQKFSIKRK